MRSKFILGPAEAPRSGQRLPASENFLAEVLADPELAGALWDFRPPSLGLDSAERPEAVFQPDDILPWGHRPTAGRLWPDPLEGLEQQGAGELKDFFGRVAALTAGAAVAGAAALDRDYLYTRSLDGRAIEIADSDTFQLTPERLILPKRADRVLVLGFVRDPKVMGMNPGLAKLRPARGWLDWPAQVEAVLALADWLGAGGYLALPSAGGLMMAGHQGVLAGLGELGRQGLLISPEYGPNLRLFTILTDYPFQPGRPLVFGVADYCETCQRCITECPAKALTEGHRRPGLYQWPVNRRACFDNWLEKKDPCRKCIEVCPYTREPLVGSPGGAQRPAAAV